MVKLLVFLTLGLAALPPSASAYVAYRYPKGKSAKTTVKKSTATTSDLPVSFGSAGFGARSTAPLVTAAAPQTTGAAAPAVAASSESAKGGANALGVAGATATGNAAGSGGPGLVVAPAGATTTGGADSGGGAGSTGGGSSGTDYSCPAGMHRESTGCVNGTTGLINAAPTAGHSGAQ
jgi:hypothetical protein